jgi:hypothetical protein
MVPSSDTHCDANSSRKSRERNGLRSTRAAILAINLATMYFAGGGVHALLE